MSGAMSDNAGTTTDPAATGGTWDDLDAEAQHEFEVTESREVFSGGIISVRSDTVTMPGGGTSQRDVVEHPGAVGIVALDGPEGSERVLTVRQYRHPVRRRLVELPAGLLDKQDEPAVDAAARELVEETGHEAARWDVLVDALNSPGMANEAIRVYLARDLRRVEQPETEHEEADMTTAWVPLTEAVEAVLEGKIENGMAIMGILAAAEARRRGYTGLRPADAAWPAKPAAGG
jgi:8-oxo-dGTP pyrophosphatase MutT (NUDIX family)